MLSHFSHIWLFATPARFLCPWDSPGKNTGVGGPAQLQGIFPTQGTRISCLSCTAIRFFPAEPPGKAITFHNPHQFKLKFQIFLVEKSLSLALIFLINIIRGERKNIPTISELN